MSEKCPKTLVQFRKWLEVQIEEVEQLCEHGDSDYFNEFEVAQVVQDARRLAGRFGFGEPAEPVRTTISANDGLAILGSIYARVVERMEQPAELLSVKAVGRMLGISPRTVWRRNSAHEIPAPVKVGGLTMWRRNEIEARIVELEAVKR